MPANACLPSAELGPGYQLPHWVLEEVERIGERQKEKEGRWAERQAEGTQGWGRGEQPVRPPSPRVRPLEGPPVLQPLSTLHDGGGRKFRAAPSSPERAQPVPFCRHPGKRMQSKSASSPGPHFHGQPLPRGLCISRSWFSIALATSAHTGVSMWASDRPMRVAWATMRHAWAVCAVLKESRSLGVPLSSGQPAPKPHPLAPLRCGHGKRGPWRSPSPGVSGIMA